MSLPLRWSVNETPRDPSLWTDNDYYAPGEPVTITGTGWRPRETITLTIRRIPSAGDTVTVTVRADAGGRFTNSEFSPEPHDDGVVTYWVTATGSSSPLETEIVFLDCVRPQPVSAPHPSPPCVVVVRDESEIVGTAVVDADR